MLFGRPVLPDVNRTQAGSSAPMAAGRQLADLALTPDGTRLLVVDEEAGELVVLRRRGPQLDAPRRVPVSPFPVSVQITADGATATVASLWSRRLTVVDLSRPDDAPSVRKSVALPFAPREDDPTARA